MKLRTVTMDDARTLLEWSNDPVTRSNSFSKEPISYETHVNWLSKKLEDECCLFLVLENNDGDLCGTIRYDLNSSQEAVISYTVSPDHRKKGYGSLLLRLGEEKACESFGNILLCGHVKADNLPSQKCFIKCGYKIRKQDSNELEFVKPIA